MLTINPPPTNRLPVTETEISQETLLPKQLLPFDLEAALLLTNGNAKLLHKLILMFQKNYENTVVQLQTQLASGSYEEAERLAHSLKGVAGTLAASELQVAAAALEHAFKTLQLDTINTLITNLETSLNPALKAAASLKQTATATIKTGASVTLDNEVINASLLELQQHISQNALKARKLFEQLQGHLLGKGVDSDVEALGEKLECLDFQAALPYIDQLIIQLIKERT